VLAHDEGWRRRARAAGTDGVSQLLWPISCSSSSLAFTIAVLNAIGLRICYGLLMPAAVAALLDRLGIDFTLISPEPAYHRVGCPAIALAEEGKALLLESGGCDIVSAGWVHYRPPPQFVPNEGWRELAEDIVGRVALVVLAACAADHERLRLTAHLSGDVAEALRYLNAEVPRGSYVAGLPVFTFVDGHRMVSLFRDRVWDRQGRRRRRRVGGSGASALHGERHLVAT